MVHYHVFYSLSTHINTQSDLIQLFTTQPTHNSSLVNNKIINNGENM